MKYEEIPCKDRNFDLQNTVSPVYFSKIEVVSTIEGYFSTIDKNYLFFPIYTRHNYFFILTAIFVYRIHFALCQFHHYMFLGFNFTLSTILGVQVYNLSYSVCQFLVAHNVVRKSIN